MIRRSLLLLFLSTGAVAFSGRRSSFIARRPDLSLHLSSPKQSHTLTMRDRSVSYWFQAGDSVEVVDDVFKAGVNLRGRQGVVVETWGKCDVDPTCCCAEHVDVDLSVRVQFEGDGEGELDFLHYFGESELVKIPESVEKSSQDRPFDGMSCVAFKLDQLQVDSRPRGIASYDPMQSDSQ